MHYSIKISRTNVEAAMGEIPKRARKIHLVINPRTA